MAKRALALDLGSSSVRAIVFEADSMGSVTAVDGALARRPRHATASEPGQATFDVDDYLSDLVSCIDELQGDGSLEGVSDVGTDSQWHSIVPVDGTGRPRGELVSWADTRARRPPGAPAAGDADLEDLRQRTGCAFAPMYWTWRAPWLAAASSGASRFFGLSEYVGQRLLGDPSMSVSMASGTGLLATATYTWDEQALELAGVRAKALPPLSAPDWRGRLSEQWRRRWPSLADAVWHPVLGDGAAANLGMGCAGPGRAALTVGTSAAVRAARPGPDMSRLPAGLWRYCIDHRRVVVGAAFSSGGQLYSWALSLWEGTPAAASGAGDGAPHEVHFDLPMPVGAGSEGVLVLPWHAGTRPPAIGVPGGQGCVLSLGLGHSGAHIVSAAVEAVCFQLAEGLDDLETMSEGHLQIVADGGAIERTPWWRGRLASTLGRAVRFPAAAETTARGAAAMALGVELSDPEADGQVVAPTDADVAALAHARSRWAACCESMLPIVGRLALDR